MIVTPSVVQTPLLAGNDPFERFPEAGVTSTGRPEPVRLRRESGLLETIISSLATAAAALVPTASSPLSTAGVIRNLADRIQVTQADFTDLLPLLGFGALPQPAAADRPAQPALAKGSAGRALAASADLTGWLGMTEEQIADLAGFSRRNYSNWRAGQGSYLKTVRDLFEIHALVGGLVRELGTDGAMAWMALPSATGRPRRQLLATSLDRAQLLSEAQPLLFVKPERESPTVDFDDEHVGAISPADVEAAKAIASAPPKRRRRLR